VAGRFSSYSTFIARQWKITSREIQLEKEGECPGERSGARSKGFRQKGRATARTKGSLSSNILEDFCTRLMEREERKMIASGDHKVRVGEEGATPLKKCSKKIQGGGGSCDHNAADMAER